MTIEEAISVLEKDRALANFNPITGEMRPMDNDCAMSVNALTLAIEALEKQIPEEVTEIHCDEYYCPSCGWENNCDQGFIYDEYCPHCGQKIDWSKDDNN